ncbi:hypothetical protein F53441_2704 [Fusarium austroafricanum]|uniref:Uncharacterized protein n=1 Tax=Fusarium austroafricanum TaxID=2364996 RepID=A0A8H4KSA1_9HYPO|nr:hypothetical protein F53441_2704 [Fusarium austroafricanum]
MRAITIAGFILGIATGVPNSKKAGLDAPSNDIALDAGLSNDTVTVPGLSNLKDRSEPIADADLIRLTEEDLEEVIHAAPDLARSRPKSFCKLISVIVTLAHEQTEASAFCSSYLDIPVIITTETSTSFTTYVFPLTHIIPLTIIRTIDATATVTSGTFTITDATTTATETTVDTVTVSTAITNTVTVTATIEAVSTSTPCASPTVAVLQNTVQQDTGLQDPALQDAKFLKSIKTHHSLQNRGVTSATSVPTPSCLKFHKGGRKILSSACSCLLVSTSTTTTTLVMDEPTTTTAITTVPTTTTQFDKITVISTSTDVETVTVNATSITVTVVLLTPSTFNIYAVSGNAQYNGALFSDSGGGTIGVTIPGFIPPRFSDSKPQTAVPS